MRFFGRKPVDLKEEKRRSCPHLVLAPRWARNEDIGKESRAIGYWCALCEKPLTLEEVAERHVRRLAA